MITELKVPQVNFKKINRPEIYDTFAQNYNKADDKLNAVANYITIREGYQVQMKMIQGNIERDKKGLYKPLDKLQKQVIQGKVQINASLQKSLEKNKINKAQFLHNIVKDVKSSIEVFLDEIKYGSSNHFNNQFENETGSIERVYNELFKTFENFTLPEIYVRILLDAIHWSEKIHIAGFNMYVLDTLIQDIVFKSYPKNLELYRELSKKQQHEIISKFIEKRPELPQAEIEELVSNLLNNVDAKGTYTHKSNGKEKGYQIIHPKDGRWEGYNINQIYHYFLDVHPKLTELVSEVAFKGRIERALKQ